MGTSPRHHDSDDDDTAPWRGDGYPFHVLIRALEVAIKVLYWLHEHIDYVTLVCVIGAFVWLSIVGSQTHDISQESKRESSAARIAAEEARTTSQESKELSIIVKENREDAILETCEDQNRRNRKTIFALEQELRVASAHLTRAQRSEIRKTRTATVTIIDALAPVENCQTELKRLTHVTRK